MDENSVELKDKTVNDKVKPLFNSADENLIVYRSMKKRDFYSVI